MKMDVINVMAAIFAVIVIVKMIALLASPQAIGNVANKIFNQSRALLTGISVVFIAIVGYLVLYNVPIQTVLATMLFTHVLIGMVLLQFPAEMVKLTSKAMKNKSKLYFVASLYIALSVWGLITIFG
jgi:hypothetical protein